MKKNKKYLVIGSGMLLVMLIFVGYALQHPEKSLSIGLHLTYTIYFVYIIIMILMFVLGTKK